MGRGYHMGFGFYGSYFFIIIILLILVLVLISNKKTSAPNPFSLKLLNILKEKYAIGTISADEYKIRKSVIEELTFTCAYTPLLLERYANCEIDSKEFFAIKKEIENPNTPPVVCEKLAKGEISINEYQSNKI
ncbi:hypothetical protein Q428_05770 [Fervidicella metallireducens AeB]|uniref:SHOCT domain-containing protein n=1 Tax=Fervidicella metallireducens AeB TaxID=1403537 RepID=A0A017RY59_9CLOT|nr:membrane protein [Fervidicella metallireducens]EYE88880.1 hypothetical protein Q428_05770 [Fervidicella metallireducens AeB]